MPSLYRAVGKVGYLLRQQLETEPGWVWRCAIALLAGLMRLHTRTLRYRINDKAGYLSGALDRSVIPLMWHNRIYSMPAVYRRRSRRRQRAVVLTSAGPEGALLMLLMSFFRMGAVRGSASRRASAALREMTKLLADGADVIITPDGSRGPRYRMQPGALFLAQSTGAPIVPIHIEYERYARLKTWDGFVIPLPFSRVDVTFDTAYTIGAIDSPEQLERERSAVERIMVDALVMDSRATAE